MYKDLNCFGCSFVKKKTRLWRIANQIINIFFFSPQIDGVKCIIYP